MNQFEIAFLLIAEICLLLYLRLQFKSWRTALILSTLALAPIYLSLERASQFLTTDGRYMIQETLNLRSSNLLQWLQGGFRTTDASLGPLAALLLKSFPQIPMVQAKIVLKNLHWLSGFALILWIHSLLNRHFISSSNKTLFFVIFAYTAFLLPTNNLALKVFNYDLLSMLMGIIAILYIVIGIRLKDRKSALFAVVLAFLGTHEKLIVSPILLFSISVYGFLSCVTDAKIRQEKLIGSLLLGVATALAAGFVSMVIVAGFRGWAVSNSFFLSISDPFVSWTWPIIKFLFGNQNFHSTAYLSILILITLSTIYALSLALILIYGFINDRPDILTRWNGKIFKANNILVIYVLVLGVVSTYHVDAYWAPHFPINPEHYQPLGELNRNILHFGAPSFLRHMISSLGYSYAVFVNAVPSAYWLCFIALLFIRRYRRGEINIDLGVEILLTTTLLLPLVFALCQIQVANRYLNLALFLLALIISVKTTESLVANSLKKGTVFLAFFAIILALEVLPFRPVYAAFRPIWSHYPDSVTPVVGKINPSWIGWGEELMLAGQILEKHHDLASNSQNSGVPPRALNLYTVYPGEWLTTNKKIKTSLLPLPLGIEKIPKTMQMNDSLSTDGSLYTESDFYVINRSSIVQRYCDFPTEVKPSFVISFRGFIQAWVFRGNQIKEAGYRLKFLGR